jgi:hypothetical protein
VFFPNRATLPQTYLRLAAVPSFLPSFRPSFPSPVFSPSLPSFLPY